MLLRFAGSERVPSAQQLLLEEEPLVDPAILHPPVCGPLSEDVIEQWRELLPCTVSTLYQPKFGDTPTFNYIPDGNVLSVAPPLPRPTVQYALPQQPIMPYMMQPMAMAPQNIVMAPNGIYI